MKVDICKIEGMVFTSPANGAEFGAIRDVGTDIIPDSLSTSLWSPFAEDECGNFFVILPSGRVGFWDHETDQVTELADSFADFVSHCVTPKEIELDQSQVRSVWIDPEFAKQTGVQAPADGWIKKEKGPNNLLHRILGWAHPPKKQ